ncbi:DUF6445 family protein [Duganella callida]|uniref:Phytanoyl-CoA dioxygenase n=1 Tax=Duganella callida TaxID=2561932 RepID=A0A4Y9S793_9BURK|nr:DUF6445 family protein [Duganella callida]TFW15597.1 hypothetical protein E4L98_26205 [Duganella callida]
MFNPRPVIQAAALDEGRYCLVVDEFLLEPHKMVDHAVAQREAFRAAPVNLYPGIEQPMPAAFDQTMMAFFDAHLAPAFGAVRALGVNTRMSIVTLKPEELMPQQRICHRDARESPPGEGAMASVLYLFDDPRLGGTSFYRPRRHPLEIDHLLLQARHLDNDAFSRLLGAPPQYYNGDPQYFDKLGTLPARWNRAIFYDATIFHSGQIDLPELLSPDPGQGRLTINAFLRYRK